MKKKLLLFTTVITSFAANAQITLADMPVAGETYVMANDTTTVSSYGGSGTGQTWNFSGWLNQKADTNAFVNASSLPGYSDFPTSNLGMAIDSVSQFMKTASTQVEILGVYGSLGFGPMALEFIPAQKFITFPSNYQTAFNGNSGFTIQYDPNQMGVDSVKLIHAIIYSSIFDASGTITTPAYSNVSALRQKYTEMTVDSMYIKLTGGGWMMPGPPTIDTTISYRWWSNAHKFTVAEIITSGNDSIENASYLVTTLVGVNEVAASKNQVQVFPNPASDKITVTGVSDASYLFIFDENGKLVERNTLKKNNTSINVTPYNNGVYFYNIIPLNGGSVTKGKFVVTK